MSFPDKYKVMFCSEIIFNIDNPTNESIDFTSWVDVPSPQFAIYSIPSPFTLRPEEIKNVGLQIKPIPSGSKVVDFIPDTLPYN